MSSSSNPKLKFSHGDDPNDAGMLQKALAKISFGKPESFGGQFRDQSKSSRTFAMFATHHVPDITKDTQIVAVLGVAQDEAAPGDSGWFLSDFMAFHHLFRKATTNQKWLHCLDLELLVKAHTKYLHGNPFQERKVVLDKSRLTSAHNSKDGHALKRMKPTSLRLDFKKAIREACAEAAKSKEPGNVLIMMFGHGHASTKGVHIGLGARNIVQTSAMKAEIKNLNVKVTLLSTACYSGGWTCHPDLNISTMTAASHMTKSKSWAKSGSLGPACGSIFATAIIDKLTHNGATGRSIMDPVDEAGEEEPLTESVEETFVEFGRSVYETLLDGLDRRGMEHGFSFGAQDDAWEMCWRERTGIPLENFKRRWDELPDWPSDVTLHPGDPQNRDPNVKSEQSAEFLQLRASDQGKRVWDPSKSFQPDYEATGSIVPKKRKTSGLYGGTDTALYKVVCALGEQYIASDQGNEDTAADGPIHRSLFRIMNGMEKDPLELEKTQRALQYRMESMSQADEYLEFMGVPSPEGVECHDFNTSQVPNKLGDSKYEAMIGLFADRPVLFPEPLLEQGHAFDKGKLYVMAAFHEAGLKKAQVIEKLDELATRQHEELETWKEVSKRGEGVTSKRQKLFNALGVALGNMSPQKRRSRGMSLTSESH